MEKEQKQVNIVNGIVKNENNEYLLVRRECPFNEKIHNRWEFPGGKVDFGETLEEATIREVKEESGFDAKIDYLCPKTHTGISENKDCKAHLIILYYICKLTGGKRCLEDKNINDVKWFSYEATLELKMPHDNKEILKFLENN